MATVVESIRRGLTAKGLWPGRGPLHAFDRYGVLAAGPKLSTDVLEREHREALEDDATVQATLEEARRERARIEAEHFGRERDEGNHGPLARPKAALDAEERARKALRGLRQKYGCGPMQPHLDEAIGDRLEALGIVLQDRYRQEGREPARVAKARQTVESAAEILMKARRADREARADAAGLDVVLPHSALAKLQATHQAVQVAEKALEDAKDALMRTGASHVPPFGPGAA